MLKRFALIVHTIKVALLNLSLSPGVIVKILNNANKAQAPTDHYKFWL